MFALGELILPLFTILIVDFGIVPAVCHFIYQMEYLVLYVCFVDCCLSFCTFSVGHCVFLFFDIQILITPLVSSNQPFSTSLIFHNLTSKTIKLCLTQASMVIVQPVSLCYQRRQVDLFCNNKIGNLRHQSFQYNKIGNLRHQSFKYNIVTCISLLL